MCPPHDHYFHFMMPTAHGHMMNSMSAPRPPSTLPFLVIALSSLERCSGMTENPLTYNLAVNKRRCCMPQGRGRGRGSGASVNHRSLTFATEPIFASFIEHDQATGVGLAPSQGSLPGATLSSPRSLLPLLAVSDSVKAAAACHQAVS